MDADVMTLNDPTLDLIDARVNAAQERITGAGTMTSRTSATRAMVTFDGSAVAVPVKMGSAVLAEEGDRVGLIKFGSDWVIVTAFAAVELGAWIDYSSTFSLTGSGGAATKGNSVYEAQYMWLNRSLVRVRIRVDFGSTFVQGSGVVALSVPVGMSTQAVRAECGSWWLNDSGVALRAGTVVGRSGGAFVEMYADGGLAAMSFGGTPFDNLDNLRATIQYEPA